MKLTQVATTFSVAGSGGLPTGPTRIRDAVHYGARFQGKPSPDTVAERLLLPVARPWQMMTCARRMLEVRFVRSPSPVVG